MHILRVRIGEAGRYPELQALERLAERLRKTLNALYEELAESDSRPTFEIVEASTGSLQLGLAPRERDVAAVLFPQFMQDIRMLRYAQFRPTMVSQTLAEYRELFKAPALEVPVYYEYGEQVAVIDDTARALLEEKIVRTRAHNVSFMGTIESVNIHRRPCSCSLFTKLSPSQRIPCVFAEELLEAIAEALRSRRVVEVVGDAEYGPVGVYPLKLTITEAPRVVEPDNEFLRKVIHSMDILPEGYTVVAYLDELRQQDEETA